MPSFKFPRFRLAPLEGIDPKAIDSGAPLGRLMIVLALVFNDLKGLIVLLRALGGTERLRAGEPLAARGQYNGLTFQVARYMNGTLHELVDVLRDDKAVIETPEFQRLLDSTTGQARNAWSALLRVAGIDSPTGDEAEISKMLVVLRNTVAFHYDRKVLGRGYRAHFESAREHTSHALFSDGKDMENTRFHFADAAAAVGMCVAARLSASRPAGGAPTAPVEEQEILNQTAQLVGAVNLALKPIVMSYLGSIAKPEPYPHDTAPAYSG